MSGLAFATRPTVATSLRARSWIAGWWAAGRMLVVVPAIVLHSLGPRGFIAREEQTHLLGALGAWDGRWYDIVAANGYLLVPGRQSDPAFFPLFPLLLRLAHAFGVGYVTAGVVIANVTFLAALVAFEALTRELLGAATARRATVYLALFPLGFVFSMAYPESLVLLTISLTALAALSGRWGIAAACGALGTLARPETMFVAAPLLVLALRERRPARRGIAFGAVVAPFAALGSFALYLGIHLHDPLAWTHAERAWGRRFTPFGLVVAVRQLPRAFAGNPWVARDVAFFVLYLGLITLARRSGVGWAWIVAGAAVVVLPTFSGSFHSLGRFGLLAPAVYWGLAAAGRGPRADRAIRWGCAVLLVAATFSLPYVFP